MPVRRQDQHPKTRSAAEDSPLYGRVIPLLFVALAVITIALILFALGVITGVIPWV